MQQYGIKRGREQHLPCMGYDPLSSPKAKPNDKGYQLLIYLDVDHCMASGIKFLRLPSHKVLATQLLLTA